MYTQDEQRNAQPGCRRLHTWILAMLLSGCSFGLTKGPPRPRPTTGPIDCTDHYGAPTADLIGGTVVGALLLGIVAIASVDGFSLGGFNPCVGIFCGSARTERPGAAGLPVAGLGPRLLVPVAGAAPFYVAAGVGIKRVRACVRAKRGLAEPEPQCHTDSECAAGLACQQGACRPAWGSIGEGGACWADPGGNLCADGLVCVARACRRRGTLPGEGQACVRDPALPVGRCSAGFVCRDGTCEK